MLCFQGAFPILISHDENKLIMFTPITGQVLHANRVQVHAFGYELRRGLASFPRHSGCGCCGAGNVGNELSFGQLEGP